MIVTDHSSYDIVRRAGLVVDSRNATQGIDAKNIVRREKTTRQLVVDTP